MARSLRQRLRSFTRSIPRPQRALALAEQALSEHRWVDAAEALDSARAALAHSSHPPDDVLARVEAVQLWLSAQHAHVTDLRVAAHALGALPDAERPQWVSIDSLRELGDSLIETDKMESAEVLADALPILGHDARIHYLAARLFGARALALRERDRDHHEALRKASISFERALQYTKTPAQTRLARIRHAELILRLAGEDEGGVAREQARAVIGPLNPNALSPASKLVYARAHLDAPSPLRRVRALDAIEQLSETAFEAEARHLLLRWLGRLQPERSSPLERDRLLHAARLLLTPQERRRVEGTLKMFALYEGAHGVDAETLFGVWSTLIASLEPHTREQAELYLRAVILMHHGGLDALRARLNGQLPPPPQSNQPFAMGLRLLHHAAAEGHTTADIEVLLRQLVDPEETNLSSLRPVALLIPTLLETWAELHEPAKALSRDLIKRYLESKHCPGFGFAAFTEALLSVGEVPLAARACRKSLETPNDPIAPERAFQVFMHAARLALESDDLPEARELLHRARALGAS